MSKTLEDIGERQLLKLLIPRLPPYDRVLVGPGDDCALFRSAGDAALVSSDTMFEGPDFRLAWTSGFELGYKAVATNLIDVAAMGGVPTALTISLGLPGWTELDFFWDFAEGCRRACDELAPGSGIVGGDIGFFDRWLIAVTVLGDPPPRPVLRSGARPGEVLAVAGKLGQASAALSLLFGAALDEEGLPCAARAGRLKGLNWDFFSAYLAPRPRVTLGQRAQRCGATSMLDISDGLVWDASRIAEASGVGLDFSRSQLLECLPSAPRRVYAAVNQDLPDENKLLEYALYGGEDYALLASFPRSVPAGFIPVGRVVLGGGISLDARALPLRGWDPLKYRS